MDRKCDIWIDLDNTPHVPFFRPIIRELRARGYAVAVTARDAFQVYQLADFFGIDCTKIGRHYGRNPALKVLGLAWRAVQLLPFVLRQRPAIALSHGSRSQLLLCNVLRIPTVMAMDYEHARMPLLLAPRWEIVPSALGQVGLQCRTPERVLTYEGIKEDVYAPDFQPDARLRETIELDRNRIIVTVRPPATEAHYHNPESEALFVAFMNRARADGNVQVILLPRNKPQEAQFRKDWPQWFDGRSVIVPNAAVDGLNLLWHSDLLVSGGGTMNREAAALGLPVYSIFRGRMGSVDSQLEREGRLMLIKDVAEVASRIELRRRDRTRVARPPAPPALASVLAHIETIVAREAGRDIRTALGETRGADGTPRS